MTAGERPVSLAAVSWFRRVWEGEQALAAAVIQRAFRDAMGANDSDTKGRFDMGWARRDALTWLFRGEVHGYDFQSLCDYLGVDGEEVTRAVLAALMRHGVEEVRDGGSGREFGRAGDGVGGRARLQRGRRQASVGGAWAVSPGPSRRAGAGAAGPG